MYLPCLVLPYQRVPGLWKTPDSVFTQTMPELLAGGVGRVVAGAGFDGAVVAGVLVDELEAEGL